MSKKRKPHIRIPSVEGTLGVPDDVYSERERVIAALRGELADHARQSMRIARESYERGHAEGRSYERVSTPTGVPTIEIPAGIPSVASQATPDGPVSLVATLLDFQELYDSGQWDEARLGAAVMHLDVEAEGEPGEIRELRKRIATAVGMLVVMEQSMPLAGGRRLSLEKIRMALTARSTDGD